MEKGGQGGKGGGRAGKDAARHGGARPRARHACLRWARGGAACARGRAFGRLRARRFRRRPAGVSRARALSRDPRGRAWRWGFAGPPAARLRCYERRSVLSATAALIPALIPTRDGGGFPVRPELRTPLQPPFRTPWARCHGVARPGPRCDISPRLKVLVPPRSTMEAREAVQWWWAPTWDPRPNPWLWHHPAPCPPHSLCPPFTVPPMPTPTRPPAPPPPIQCQNPGTGALRCPRTPDGRNVFEWMSSSSDPPRPGYAPRSDTDPQGPPVPLSEHSSRLQASRGAGLGGGQTQPRGPRPRRKGLWALFL